MFTSPRKIYRPCRPHPYVIPAFQARRQYLPSAKAFQATDGPQSSTAPATPLFAHSPRLEKAPANPAPGLPVSPFPPPPPRRFGRNPSLIDETPNKPATATPSPAPGPGPQRVRARALRPNHSIRMRPGALHARAKVATQGRRRWRKHVTEGGGQLTKLNQEIDRVIERRAHVLNPEDDLFLKQMAGLNMNRAFRTRLTEARDAMDLAVGHTSTRIKERERRDAMVEKQLKEEEQRKEKLRLEEEFRKKEVAKAAEREEQLRRERVRAEREALKREREMWERRVREKQERQRREQAARQEKVTQHMEAARLKAEKEKALKAAETGQRFSLYDGKWQELKVDPPIRPLRFEELPWPILTDVIGPDDVTYTRLQEFLFHGSREGMEGKTRRERVRTEMLRWHPDKFNAKVLVKVVEWEREAVRDAAGRVARILTQVMAEVENENLGL